MNIDFISPIPIASFQNNDFSEHQQFLNLKYNPTLDGLQSCDTYVLESYAPKLKEWIEDCIENYVKSCLASTQKVKITQSWCIKHDRMISRLHQHKHPNSFISGAYYVKCTQESNGVTFFSNSLLSDNQFEWKKDQNLLMSQHWLWREYPYHVCEGKLILFPSNLMHYVKESTIQDYRCVLSFNTWFEGTIGDSMLLTELKQ
jgi:uncharacterized protein (TIGR02466 family)